MHYAFIAFIMCRFIMTFFLLQDRKWEKGLQQVFGETSADKLVSSAKEELTKYFAALPKPSKNSPPILYI